MRYEVQATWLRDTVRRGAQPEWYKVTSRPTERWARAAWWKFVNEPVAHQSYLKVYRIFDTKLRKVVE